MTPRTQRIAASICLAAFVACSGAKAPAPAVPPPPPALLPQHPQVKPPPPEERETTVVRLDRQNCGRTDTRFMDFTSAEVLARCEHVESTTRVLLTVVPRTSDPADYLRAFSLRFCGDLINAEAPAGWKVQIEREKRRSEVAAEVTWESPDAAPNITMPISRRVSAFAVTLRGEWRTGLGYYLVFSESGVRMSGSPHDCPYPFQSAPSSSSVWSEEMW